MSDVVPGHLLINLTRDGGAAAGKALRMGRNFLGAGWRVTLLANLEAVRLVDPGATLEACPVTGRPTPHLLAAFVADGGRVLVGRECLKVAGLEGAALPAGCDLAHFATVEALLRRPDLRTLSW